MQVYCQTCLLRLSWTYLTHQWNNMIIVRLVGGLGNQLFQYAMGRNLALLKKTELKLDKSWLEKTFKVGTFRDYRLHNFNIQENFASASEIEKVKNQQGGILSRMLAKISGNEKSYIKQSVLNEQKDFVYDPNIFETGKDVYVQGYWNNEKYFKDIKDIINEEFEVKIPPSIDNIKILDEIKNCNSVSIHVRRGDYVKDKKINKHHGTCSLDYYAKAMKIVGSKISNPIFFAFSDDMSWVKKNLKTKYPVHYVDINDDEHSYEDLRLMSACKHNIIANSSFSWWGAWLNQNPDKIIIAPNKWVNNANFDTSDITPKGWIKL